MALPHSTPVMRSHARGAARRNAFVAFGRASLCIGLLLTACASGQEPQDLGRELLNSERIAQVFGNYDLEVLTSTPTVRVSRLFSTHDGEEICRTFAVAVFPDRVDAAIAAEHAAILAGGSIGSTFVAAGRRVVKTHRYVGEIDSSAKLESLMGGIAPGRLAVHVYTLGVTNGERAIDYANMIEIHHPGYLQTEALREIYGIAGLTETDSVIEQLLAVMAEQMR